MQIYSTDVDSYGAKFGLRYLLDQHYSVLQFEGLFIVFKFNSNIF